MLAIFVLLGSLNSSPSVVQNPVLLSVEPAQVRTQIASDRSLRLPLQLPHGNLVQCVLTSYSVTTPETKFVIGTRGGQDREFPFNPDSVLLLRGQIEAEPSSHVVLAVYGEHLRGRIHRGDGTVYHLAETTTPKLPASRPPNVPMCGLDSLQDSVSPGLRNLSLGEGEGEGEEEEPLPYTGAYRLRVAVETDWEYRQLFASTDEAAAYIVLCFGLIADIYDRDVEVNMEVTYVRLWESEDDLFNEENPLGDFREYWNKNMDFVPRSVAQFFSGRRNFPYGGVAWLSAVCRNYGYSVTGYVLGFTGDITRPDVFNYDVHVAAHEIGHNCGTLHTHDYDIDECNDLYAPPVRGGIMSYCSQTTSGGNAVTDVRFHKQVQLEMRSHFLEAHEESPLCFPRDCNENSVPDPNDIISGMSTDVNSNGVLDECEDCNENGLLDPEEVLGTKFDLNLNGIPDECEPDCNDNGQPDDFDIKVGTSLDIWGNGIPDECEADCNEDGESDYNQIQHDMALDLDRDLILDSCQDCDGNDVLDLEELDGAWAVWAGSDAVHSERDDSSIVQFHSVVGTRLHEVHGGDVPIVWEVLITEDRRILATSPLDNRVVEYDEHGTWVGDLVPAGSGLEAPTGMARTSHGTLLVSSTATNQVLEFDEVTGEFLGVFAEGTPWGFIPLNILVTVDDRALIVSAVGSVEVWDTLSGKSLGTLVDKADNGGLAHPRGIEQLPGGDIAIASMGTNQILRFDSVSGEFLGVFNNGGTDTALTMDEPWGVRVGPDANVYVSRHGAYDVGEDDGHDHGDGGGRDPDTGELHINATRIYIFDGWTGNFIRSYVTGHDTDFWQPTGFDFMPGDAIDCNQNGRPDSCDLLSGTSEDVNDDDILDECQCLEDIDRDSSVGVEDLLVVLSDWGICPWCGGDITGDGYVNIEDLLLVIGAWGDCFPGG